MSSKMGENTYLRQVLKFSIWIGHFHDQYQEYLFDNGVRRAEFIIEMVKGCIFPQYVKLTIPTNKRITALPQIFSSFITIRFISAITLFDINIIAS